MVICRVTKCPRSSALGSNQCEETVSLEKLLLSPCISYLRSPYQRSIFLQSMGTNRDPHLDNVQRRRDFEALSPEWDVLKALSSKLSGLCRAGGRKTEEPEVTDGEVTDGEVTDGEVTDGEVTDGSEETASSRHNRADAHMNSDTVAAHT